LTHISLTYVALYSLYPKPSCFRRHRHQKPTRRPPPPFHPSSFQLSPLNPQNNIIRCRCSSGRFDNNNHVYAFLRRITPSSQRARRCGRLQVLVSCHAIKIALFPFTFRSDYKGEGLAFLAKLGFHVLDQELSAPAAMDPYAPPSAPSDFFDQTSFETFCL
jgi:hypothetical protein